jgi:hypothetical protein
MQLVARDHSGLIWEKVPDGGMDSTEREQRKERMIP